MTIGGIHHVTSMAGDPGHAVAFYRDVLGLRLVKRTVNFDDPTTYHLYFGDAVGTPGTALTLFPYPAGRPGRAGVGQATTASFRVPPGSLPFWRDRFAAHDVDHEPVRERFGREVLPFEDRDGLAYALVEDDKLAGDVDVEASDLPSEHAIRGFFGVTLTVERAEPTADVLAAMGADWEGTSEQNGVERSRYRFREDSPGQVVDLAVDPAAPPGAMGVGSVHHVAFRTADEQTQRTHQQELRDRGLHVTEVKDRRYFRSVYFREPGGVLFEIATDGPGFTADEARADLGGTLQLPPWLEDERERIESELPPLDTTEVAE